MKLYLVTNEHSHGYDTYDSFIIVCENEEEARGTHPSHDDKKEGWYDDWIAYDKINELTVEYLGEAAPNLEKGVILASYNAG